MLLFLSAFSMMSGMPLLLRSGPLMVEPGARRPEKVPMIIIEVL